VPVDTALCVLVDASEAAASAASGQRVREYKLADEVCDEVTAMSGPPSMLLCAADTDELCDLSLFHYSVLHSSKALPSIGLCYKTPFVCFSLSLVVNLFVMVIFLLTSVSELLQPQVVLKYSVCLNCTMRNSVDVIYLFIHQLFLLLRPTV